MEQKNYSNVLKGWLTLAIFHAALATVQFAAALVHVVDNYGHVSYTVLVPALALYAFSVTACSKYCRMLNHVFSNMTYVTQD